MLKLYDGKTTDFKNTKSDIIQNAYDAKVEFDKGYMLTFKVLIDDRGLHKKIKNEMIVVCKGGYKNRENAFRIKERLEFGTYVEFKCPHIFYDLDNKRTKVPSGLFNAGSVIDIIRTQTEDIAPFKFNYEYIYGGNRLEFGNYKELKNKKADEKVEPKVEYYNTLELMNKIFNEYDCEYMFDFYTINIRNKMGEHKENILYEYKNIEDWESTKSMDKRATKVIAQSDFEETTTYKAKYPEQKLYIHFAYGNDKKGKDFTNTNYQSRTYIGYYVDTKYLNSSNPKDYKWVSMKIPPKSKKKPAFKGDRKVKGITSFMVGTDYRDGIPIKLDKKTFYLHTAFANYLDGKDININDGTGAKYVGFMLDDKKDNTRVKQYFTFNHLTEKGGLLINDRRTLKNKVHLETIVESPLINNYAQIYTDTYVNNELKTEQELIDRVNEMFEQGLDKPKRTIKCQVKITNNDSRRRRSTTLNDILYLSENDPCDIYDTLILRYLTHNVDERIKCIGFEYDPINDSLNYLKFGTKDKENSVSASVSSGVKAKLNREVSDLDKHIERRDREVEEELRRYQEEFNHIWLSEKIDFINGFSKYGEYFEDFQAELDRIDEERKRRKEELDKRLADADARFEETKKRLNEQQEEVKKSTTEIKSYVNSEIEKSGLKNGETIATFKKDVDSLKGQILGIENNKNKISELSQTINGLTSKVAETSQLSTKYSELKQTVDGMSNMVSYIGQDNATLFERYSKIDQKVDSITSIVGSNSSEFDEKITSAVEQKADSITLSVSRVSGLDDELEELRSSIQINKDSITQVADNIDFKGKVSFRDLNSEGKDERYDTFIDGGKIITNTIEARSIKAGAIQADHLKVDQAFVDKLMTDNLLANKIVSDEIVTGYINTVDISASRIKTGYIRSKKWESWIDLDEGKFSFFNNALFIDETLYDGDAGHSRVRLHTKGTFRLSYANRPIIELNSGGIVFFHDGANQNSTPYAKMRANENGVVDILSKKYGKPSQLCVTIGDGSRGDSGKSYVMHVNGSMLVKEDFLCGDGKGNSLAYIGKDVDGFVMNTFGSLRVRGNLQVDKSIKYGDPIYGGGSISKGRYSDK